MKDSEYSGSADLGMVYTLAKDTVGKDEYKKEYLTLVREYEQNQKGVFTDMTE